jgi:drug/metabolite transporter (DMT)-like permease
MSGRRADLVALAAVVGAALVWSSSYSVTKVALRTFPPFTIGLLRFALATALLAAFVRVRRPSVRPSRGDLARLACGGVIGTTIYFAIENMGVKLATASDAALLVAAYPAITLFLEMVIYRRRPAPVKMGGVVIAIVGVYLIVANVPSGSSPHRLAGDVLLVVSGVVWAFYNFATRAVRDRYSTREVIYYQTAAGTLAFVPLACTEYATWRTPHPSALLAVSHLGVLCSVAAFFLYAYGLKRLEASTAVGVLNLVPVFGVIIAIGFLGESLTALQLIGGAVVIGGVTIGVRSETSFRRPAPAHEDAPGVPLASGVPDG